MLIREHVINADLLKTAEDKLNELGSLLKDTRRAKALRD
jgi:hypothetical protein